MAQVVARLVRNEKVGSSSLPRSTSKDAIRGGGVACRADGVPLGPQINMRFEEEAWRAASTGTLRSSHLWVIPK